MKNLLVILFFLLCNNLISTAKNPWKFIDPVPTDDEINDIYFIDEYHGFIVGWAGTVLKTTDGGIIWDEVNIPDNEYYIFSQVKFFDNMNGIIFGQDSREEYKSVLFKTSDEGESWLRIIPDLNNSQAYGFLFKNSEEMWCTNRNYQILKSTDGGYNWEIKYSENSFLGKIFFINDLIGWVNGRSFILKTTDGGETWSRTEYSVASGINDVFFIDENNGWACGINQNIIKSSDGGNNWILVNHSPGDLIFFRDIKFLDTSTGFVCGYYGVIYKTTNSGNTWFGANDVTWYYIGTLNKIFILNENNIYICGDDGYIETTSDLGITWEKLFTYRLSAAGDKNKIYGIHPINKDCVFIYGSRYQEINRQKYFPFICKVCNNDTIEWSEYIFREPELYTLSAINYLHYFNEKGGLAFQISPPYIHKTTNGGTTWQEKIDSLPINSLSKIIVFDSLNYIIYDRDNHRLLNSRDCRIKWDSLSLYPEFEYFTSWFFISPDIGWIAGDSGVIYKTIDGGKNWNLQFSYFKDNQQSLSITDIFFKDDNIGWAVINRGSYLLKTTNSGIDWQMDKFISDSIYGDKKFKYLNDTLMYILCGSKRVLYKSNDGGESWKCLPLLPSSVVSNILFIDENNIWITSGSSSDHNVIMKTSIGGDTITSVTEYAISPPDLLYFEIFPNIFTLKTNIKYKNLKPGKLELGIYDLFGRNCYNTSFEENTTGEHVRELLIPDLEEGMYFVQMKMNGCAVINKVIIIK